MRLTITAISVFTTITTACVVVVFTSVDWKINDLLNGLQLAVALFGAIIYLFLISKLKNLGYEWLKKPVRSIKLQFSSIIAAFVIDATFRLILSYIEKESSYF